MVLALDASLSMMAHDERPSRLERMKQEVRRLRALSPGDRVGLLAFAGRSYVLSPLTVDEGALDLFLDNLDPSRRRTGGQLAGRDDQAGHRICSTLTKSGADRALVVMSDGEAFEPEDDVVAAAQRAAEQNVSLVTVGFGTTAGKHDSDSRERHGRRTKKDENGQTVITHYTPDLLKAAAEAANGTFIPAEATDKAARIKAALSTLRAPGARDGDGRQPHPALPVVPAARHPAALAGYGARGTSWSRKRRAAAAETALAAGLVAAVTISGCAPRTQAVDAAAAYAAKDYHRAATLFAEVARDDRSPGSLYNYGTALLADDSMTAAVEVLDRAADKADDETRYRARFNSGLASLIPGLVARGDSGSADLDKALASYKRVLLQRPDDLDAKWNYELALRKKKQGGGGGGGGQSNSSPAPSPQEPKPQPTLAQRQAEQLLGSAEREERDVQSRKQKQSRQEPPPGGKDW